jgi:hypothetical protein
MKVAGNSGFRWRNGFWISSAKPPQYRNEKFSMDLSLSILTAISEIGSIRSPKEKG